ncbi:hypothetical protein [Nitrosopumilus sp.]|uniref:hypothetical protein n=1 Tax=Nitrosopumilus sp. TaxID=2024843 RepID=UPI003D09FF23
MSAKKSSKSFRSWFYFRTGWSVYFAFIFAAINTLVVTYYLAIENIPILQQIFPSFTHYVIVTVIVGIPVLVGAGYIHFKRSAGFKSEADVAIETNPHARRNLLNTEVIVAAYLFSNEMVMKMLKDEKLTDEEIKKFNQLQEKIKEHFKHKTISGTNFDIN